MPRYVLTGGLGVGKTSVLAVLDQEFQTIAEPARILIAEHQTATGEPTLDHRPQLFVERLVSRSIESFNSVAESTISVFDRGLPDCVAYALVSGVDAEPALRAAREYRYDSPVFVAPPWEAIYENDEMRRATFDQSKAFHAKVVTSYEQLGYELIELPRSSAEERAAFISSRIG